jgi:hypothetical protein
MNLRGFPVEERMMVHRDSLGPRPVRAFVGSVVATGRLAATGRLRSPRTYLASRLHFADGTTSFVFRETAVGDGDPADPAVLVVQFRLWALGRSPLLHALFRRECILHTPLFAGFPGFRAKLWASDTATGVYRGLYQWDGADQAANYAATLSRLLRPFSTRGSVRYHIIPGLRRDDVLGDPGLLSTEGAGEQGAWWRLATPVQPAPVQPAPVRLG